MSGLGYFTLDEVVRIYCVTRAYAYKMACTKQWGRYRHPDGRTRYRREHVDRDLAPGGDRRKTQRQGKVLNVQSEV